MVSTRQTPSGRTTIALDGSPVVAAVDNNDDDTIKVIDQLSVSFLPFQLFLYIDFLDPAHFYPAELG